MKLKAGAMLDEHEDSELWQVSTVQQIVTHTHMRLYLSHSLYTL